MKTNSWVLRGKDSRAVVFLPQLVYDLLAYLCFPLNYLINLICYFQPNARLWDDDSSVGPQALEQSVSKERLAELQTALQSDSLEVYSEREIVALYDSLPAAKPEDLIGHTFTGRIVRAGCFLDVVDMVLVRPLMKLGLAWGKRYRTKHTGDPLLVSWNQKVFFPVPVWGNVGMTSILWRGDYAACMNYDHQPWKDYFKVLSAPEDPVKVFLGVWTARELSGGWFVLTTDPATPVN